MRARDNPFTTDRVLRIRYHFENDSWDAVLGRLSALGNRAAIIGPEGSGKTTLLEDLDQRLAAIGYCTQLIRARCDGARLRITGVSRRPAHLSQKDIVLFDSCEALGPINWRLLRWQTRRAAGLVVTAHQPGRLPTLIRCVTTPNLLARFVAELLGTDHGLSANALHELYSKHRGNIRDALRELYDIFARDRMNMQTRNPFSPTEPASTVRC